MAPPQGPSTEDLTAATEAARQLSATFQQMLGVFNQFSNAGERASSTAAEMTSLFNDFDAAMGKTNRSGEQFRKMLEQQIESIESFSDAAGVMKTILKNMGSGGKLATAAIAGLSGALKGMAAGFKFSFNLAKSFLGGVKSMIGAVFDLTAAILSVPFKLWESLIGMAKGGGGGGGGLLEALEKVREVFGDIKKGAGAEVIDIARGLASWGDMAPGLFKVSRQFGTLKDAIEYVMKLAGPAPVLFSSLKDEFEKTGKNVFIMAKGLGIGEEEFAGLMNAAKSFGQSVESIEVEMTKFAKGLSSEFGLNSKLMSRDMAKAMKDVKHFANSSVKEIAKATAYAHSLGLELKDITGILDAFNTFDQAAENVSKLSQAFGVNIDVMKLVEAKTPDEALKMLKDSLSSAGKSVENMNRQELQLLASTVGMSEEAVRQGLSSKNQAISMNRLAASTDHLAKKTMTASEATNALKNDIERVVQGGGGGGPESNSLLGMFFEGFMQGITTSKEFMRIFKNLRMDIQIVMEQGRQLGRAFVEMFPGVKKFFEGLGDILSPDKIGGLFRSYKETFIKFFKDLGEGKGTVRDLMEGLKKNFMDYLTKSGPGGQKVLDGLQEFWGAIKRVMASAIDYVGDLLRDGLNTLIDVIDGKYRGKIGAAMGKVGEEVSPILSALGGLFDKVKGPLTALFDKFWGWATKKLGELFSEHWTKIMAVMIGPSLVAGLGSGIMSFVSARLVQGPIVSQLKKMTGLLAGKAEGIAGAASGAARSTAEAAKGVQGIAKPLTNEQFTATFRQGMVSHIGHSAVDLLAFKVKAGMMLDAMSELMDIVKEKGKDLNETQFRLIETIINAVMSFYTRMQMAQAAQSLISKIPGGGGGFGGGGWKEIGAGLAGMAITIYGMLKAAKEIISMAKQEFDVKKLEAVVTVIEATGNMFIKAAAVLGASALLGAFSVLSKGAGALLMAVGMAEIDAVVIMFLSKAQNILTELNSMNLDAATIDAKTKAFASIGKTVVELVDSAATLIDNMPLTSFSFESTIKTTLESAEKLIQSLIGSSTGGGLMGITNAIFAFVREMPADKLKAAEGIGAVLSGAAQMFSALSQGVSALQSTYERSIFGMKTSAKGIGLDVKGGGDQVTQEGKKVTDQLEGLKNFFTNVVGSISTSIIGPMKDLMPKISLSDANKMGAFGQMMGASLSGLGSIFSALAGPMNSFRTKRKDVIDVGFGLASSTEDLDTFDANAFREFATLIENIGPKVAEGMTKIVGGISDAAIDAAEGITDKNIAGVKAVIDLIGAAGQIMGYLTGAAKEKQVGITAATKVDQSGVQKGVQVAVTNAQQIQIVLPDLTKVLEAMGKELPTMIKGIFKAAKEAEVSPADLTALKTVGDVMKGISEMIRVLYEVIVPATKTYDLKDQASRVGHYLDIDPEQTAEQMKKGFESFTILLMKLNSQLIIKDLVDAANKIPKIPAGTIENIKGLKELFSMFKEVNSVLSDLGPVMEAAGSGPAPLPAISTDAFSNLGDITGIGQSIDESIPATPPNVNALKQKFDPLKAMIDQLSSPDSGLPQLMSSVTTLNSTLSSDKIEALKSAKTASETFFTNFNEVSSMIAQGIQGGTDQGIATIAESVKQHIGRMTAAINEFNSGLSAISSVEPGQINLKLGTIANGLGVRDASYAITRGPVNFQFKINVQVSGKEMSEAVSAPGTVIFQAFQNAGNSGGNWDTGANPLSVTKK